MSLSLHRQTSSANNAQRGFTLLESLVALVVLSVGLLGVAKLVLGAVHADDSAYMRGQATQLAYELLDQMRANRPGAIASNYVYPGTVPTNNNCNGAACTPLQLAQLDLFNFNSRVTSALPTGTFTVAIATLIGTVTGAAFSEAFCNAGTSSVCCCVRNGGRSFSVCATLTPLHNPNTNTVSPNTLRRIQ